MRHVDWHYAYIVLPSIRPHQNTIKPQMIFIILDRFLETSSQSFSTLYCDSLFVNSLSESSQLVFSTSFLYIYIFPQCGEFIVVSILSTMNSFKSRMKALSVNVW